MRTLGSIGQGDLMQLADLAADVFRGVDARGEGRARAPEQQRVLERLGGARDRRYAHAARRDDARRRPRPRGVRGQSHAAARGRRHGQAVPGPRRGATAHCAAALEGSRPLASRRRRRNLQDPLSFRGAAAILGAARDALGFVERPGRDRAERVAGEPDDGARRGSHHLGRQLREPAARAGARPHAHRPDSDDHRGERASHQAPPVAADAASATVCTPPACPRRADSPSTRGRRSRSRLEARLLGQPVSLEIPSASQAEGIEDRASMAPLAARRLSELVDLGRGVVAIELVVAAQAVELRHGAAPDAIGVGARRAFRRDPTPRPVHGSRARRSPPTSIPCAC